MTVYDINFDATAFASADILRDDLYEELHEEFIVGFNEISLAEGNFPTGVLEVIKASISPDDSNHEDGEWKVFANITLRMEVSEEQDPHQIEAPERLLATLVDSLNIKVDLDGEWEVLDIDPIEQAVSPAA